MNYTVILVKWFKFQPPKTNIHFGVNQNIHTVYAALKQEGSKVQVYKIPEFGDEIKVSIEEVDREAAKAEEATYHLIVDLIKSKMSFERFNELIEELNFDELVGDDED
jgi:hypothetical protein